jgi:hypothetical protein
VASTSSMCRSMTTSRRSTPRSARCSRKSRRDRGRGALVGSPLTRDSRATRRRMRPTSSVVIPTQSSSSRTCLLPGSRSSSARAASARARSCTPASHRACAGRTIWSWSCSPIGEATAPRRLRRRCGRLAASMRALPILGLPPRSRRAPTIPAASWSSCSTSSRSISSITRTNTVRTRSRSSSLARLREPIYPSPS